jgi:hypothetical protein
VVRPYLTLVHRSFENITSPSYADISIEVTGGNDAAIYNMAEIAGFTDRDDAGRRIDKLLLEFTASEWQRADVQGDCCANRNNHLDQNGNQRRL